MAGHGPNSLRRAAALLGVLVSVGGLNVRRMDRRAFTRAGVSAAALSAVLAPSERASALIRGAKASASDAARLGVVGLFISMADCEVCIKDLPAACTGVLIGPQLVLSASHCLDLTEGLGGKLTKIVFGDSLIDPAAVSVPVQGFVLASQYGKELNNDLLLIRLREPAPPEWTIQPIAPFPTPGSPDDYPGLEILGFGDSVDNEQKYSAGLLGKLKLQAISPVSKPTFLTMVLDKQTGTCSGDSGAAAIASSGANQGKGVIGVLSQNSVPCTGSNGLFISPAAFKDFIRRGARDLDLPSPV
jgi:secreted trypsin-like serine protease